MAKVDLNITRNYFHYICFFTFIYTPLSLLAEHDRQCVFCGSSFECEELVNNEELGEYKDMYRTFEEEMEAEEHDDYSLKCGVFSRWNKKLKRWIKHRTVSLIKKMVNLKKIRNSEDCAYTVANFKRKIDDVHNTGNIEDMLDKFGDFTPNDPCYEGMEKFKNRIRYYHYNKNEKPPKHPNYDRYNFCFECSHKIKGHKTSDLDEIPARALIGGVEIACGSLIMAIPFPGCKWLGWSLVTHGTTQVYEGYMSKYENESTF